MSSVLAKVGDDVCDPGNNNIGCDYDGGDCCLPQAEARDCIDPCGVRLKFYGGQNSGFDACWSDKHFSTIFREMQKIPGDRQLL